MFFPGSQPRVEPSLFRFRCLNCGTEIDLDDSMNGECVECSAQIPEKKPDRMSREEKKRLKKQKKALAKVKHAKRCERSTITKGEKTSNH